VQSPYGAFRGGPAIGQAIAAACNDFECGNDIETRRVTLRR
jgi:hypothetical protein